MDPYFEQYKGWAMDILKYRFCSVWLNWNAKFATFVKYSLLITIDRSINKVLANLAVETANPNLALLSCKQAVKSPVLTPYYIETSDGFQPQSFIISIFSFLYY